MIDDVERSLRALPASFRSELAAIQAGARHGGVISPRRFDGLRTSYGRVEGKYRAKLATLRGHGPSLAIDDADRAITGLAEEFAAGLSTDNAA
jgi:hypothetical protein